MKKVLLIFLILLISCDNRTDEEKKLELDEIYSSVKSLPSSKPCENLKGYKKLKSREIKYGTNFYKNIYEVKINDYEKKCSQLQEQRKLEELRLAELEKLGSWSFGRYVDEFGDPTGEKYVQNETYGSFSNSATDDSSLRVEMMISSDDQNKPWFRIYEYNSMKVKGYYDWRDYPCRIKSSDDEIFDLRLQISDGTDYFRIITPGKWDGKEYIKKWGNLDKLNKLISEGKSAKFSCYELKTPSTKYRFDFNFKYYENAIRKMSEL
mgnify:CR=1 FL=1